MMKMSAKVNSLANFLHDSSVLFAVAFQARDPPETFSTRIDGGWALSSVIVNSCYVQLNKKKYSRPVSPVNGYSQCNDTYV